MITPPGHVQLQLVVISWEPPQEAIDLHVFRLLTQLLAQSSWVGHLSKSVGSGGADW